MSKRRPEDSQGDQDSTPQEVRSAGIAANGVATGKDFANLMSALMSDVITGRVTPSVANAACNAGGKLLKVVEMSHRYGLTGPGDEKTLSLTSPMTNERREAALGKLDKEDRVALGV